MAMTNDLQEARAAAASLRASLGSFPGAGAVGIAIYGQGASSGSYGIRVNVADAETIRTMPGSWDGVDIDFLLVESIEAQGPETEEIQVGTIVYGFCNGVFGRDSYEDKVVIARGEHAGEPWAVLAVTDDSWSGRADRLYLASGRRDFELMAANLHPAAEDRW